MTIQLRDYQWECFDCIKRDLEFYQKLLCVLPCGVGKTTIFGKVAKWFGEQTHGKVVVVSHLDTLTKQTAKRFQGEWGLTVGILQADAIPNDEDVVITTRQSFSDRRKSENWAGSKDIRRNNVKLIIIDEAHMDGSDEYVAIKEMYPDAKVIGFTATPFRENKLMTNLYDVVSFTRSMQWFIDRQYLVEPRLHLTAFPDDMAEQMAMILEIIKTKHKEEKAVVFMKTIVDADNLRHVLLDGGVKTSAITSKVTGELRDKLLEEFVDGDIQTLTTVDVLTAGFDAPPLKAIIIPNKVSSVTTYLQRIGRGARPFTNKHWFDIYVAGKNPKIDKEFWEKMHKKALIANARSTDELSWEDLIDMLENGKELMEKEELKWTKEVVDLAKSVRKKGMTGLADCMVRMDFPKEMLNKLVEHQPFKRKNCNAPLTEKQAAFLEKKNLPTANLTKTEATALIEANGLAEGWMEYKDWEVVKTGKHEGKHYKNVPWSYWNYFKMKSPNQKVYKDYKYWLDRRGY